MESNIFFFVAHLAFAKVTHFSSTQHREETPPPLRRYQTSQQPASGGRRIEISRNRMFQKLWNNTKSLTLTCFQEISNMIHFSRTPKPEFLIALATCVVFFFYPLVN